MIFMHPDDMFKPYSSKIGGDLIEYLRKHDGSSADNLFHGPEYFFVIRDKRLMNPGLTCVRVNQSPLPDIAYFVNSDHLLESRGQGSQNMSLIGAEEGVYDPKEALRGLNWSISGLKLWE